MEMHFIASKLVPGPNGGNVKQQVIVRFIGSRESMEELMTLLRDAGYEIT